MFVRVGVLLAVSSKRILFRLDILIDLPRKSLYKIKHAIACFICMIQPYEWVSFLLHIGYFNLSFQKFNILVKMW